MSFETFETFDGVLGDGESGCIRFGSGLIEYMRNTQTAPCPDGATCYCEAGSPSSPYLTAAPPPPSPPPSTAAALAAAIAAAALAAAALAAVATLAALVTATALPGCQWDLHLG